NWLPRRAWAIGGIRLTWLPRKEPVADVSRGRCQPDAAGLAPRRLVDLPLVTDLQGACCLAGDEDRIAHLAPGLAVSLFDFLPQPEPTKSKLGQFFLDLATDALLVVFSGSLPAARKHPAPVAPSPDQKGASALDGHQF